MNRYPLWKNALIVVVMLFAIIYTLPNFFGESPATQVTSATATVKASAAVAAELEEVLRKENINYRQVLFENRVDPVIKILFNDTDARFRSKSVMEKHLNPEPNHPRYTISFNLLPNTPTWLQKIGALPMYLGLDLRGGVHFLMQVNTTGVIEKRLNGMLSRMRVLLREADIRYQGVLLREGDKIVVRFDTAAQAQIAITKVNADNNELNANTTTEGSSTKVTFELRPEILKTALDESVKQNVATLSKRVNELGVAEPVIQQQGQDRIVVQLPGVQDIARAKDIIGRTATLEVRMVDERVPRGTELSALIPPDSELLRNGRDAPVVLKREVTISGEYITNASATFDQNQEAAVAVDLNSDGGRRMRDATRERVGKLMSIVLYEKGRGEVLTVATIRDVLGSRFQITGMGSATASNDLALLLRAGALAAPMEIIEERTVGPQLGAENITKGVNSVLFGFAAIALFMALYYMLFGVFSVIALAANLFLLIAVLSVLQATLTLPGFAAIALVLGMAIDSNVLINERIREELRNGATPQMAINVGFERAWATILDSNITTLIAGLCLTIFGSGALRGFGLVHSLGILTSLFCAVLVARALSNAWYGSRRKLATLSIGQARHF